MNAVEPIKVLIAYIIEVPKEARPLSGGNS